MGVEGRDVLMVQLGKDCPKAHRDAAGAAGVALDRDGRRYEFGRASDAEEFEHRLEQPRRIPLQLIEESDEDLVAPDIPLPPLQIAQVVGAIDHLLPAEI